jgi:putative restriction endonuclease
MSRNNWTEEEHILAFNLYCKIPFTKINANYPPVRDLARVLGRTDGSVAMKLANFARLDPVLKARNISGLTQGAKGEEEVWNKFNDNWEELVWQSEQILARYQNNSIENFAEIIKKDLPPEGKERDAIVKIRVNQAFFRKTVLASFNYRCCITGLSIPQLLIASHIIPWANNKEHRMNPANGLCLNALHDRAFDKGLITVKPDLTLKISTTFLQKIEKTNLNSFFLPYNERKISLPNKFLPLREFLEYHNSFIFEKGKYFE